MSCHGRSRASYCRDSLSLGSRRGSWLFLSSACRWRSSILRSMIHFSLDFFSRSSSRSRSPFEGTHLLRKIRLTASGLILNFSASTGVVNMSGSCALRDRKPSMACRESLRGGDHPSGKFFFIVSRWALYCVGVGESAVLLRRAAERLCCGGSSECSSSSASTSERGAGPATRHFRSASPETVE